MEFETVQTPVLFEHIRKVFKSQSDLKEISLDFEIPDNLPAVRADANKIAWVLSNLISNALRYTGKGGHIKLLARGTGAHVNLSVQDDGLGIPLAYQSKIFKKFVQIKGREGGGTGLGLAICKEIVNAHGGSIWVESSPGQGSTFTFTLPVNKHETR
jgi:NtrC-family two-component system sensor histidine kinase KinB